MNQPNFVIDSGAHPFLHPNCHHQIVFSKLSLKIEYPPLFERLVRDYENADSQPINKAIEIFNWESYFKTKTFMINLNFLMKQKSMLSVITL